MLAVPLLKDQGSHLRGVLGQGRNIPAKCQDDDNDEKVWMGMIIVMLMMKTIMMTRRRIRRTKIMIEQPVEEEVQVGSVCPPT